MVNRMTPPAEGQEKDVPLVLDKQQGKVSAVKGIDKDGKGVEFNGHVQPGAQGKSPGKVQPKDVPPAAKSRTQVAVNSGARPTKPPSRAKSR